MLFVTVMYGVSSLLPALALLDRISLTVRCPRQVCARCPRCTEQVSQLGLSVVRSPSCLSRKCFHRESKASSRNYSMSSTLRA
jgi:hypothetical protein